MNRILEHLQPFFKTETGISVWKQKEGFCLERASARNAGWKHQVEAEGLLPTEYLLPRIYCPCPTTPPAFMSVIESVEATDMLRQQRDALSPWGFWFKLASNLNTKSLDIQGRNRITCRSHLITSTVEKLLGQRIQDATVLDIACHSGFFTMDMASRGAKHVTGVELRKENIQQALFIQEHYGIQNASFEQGDISQWQPNKSFSVVLNLGLLYHVIDPVTLIRQSYEWCEDFAVVDTICHKEPVSAFIAAFNKDNHHPGEGKHTVELQPTYRAVIDTMHDAGFIDLIELIADPSEGGRASDFYRSHQRRCIIGFKRPIEAILGKAGVLAS